MIAPLPPLRQTRRPGRRPACILAFLAALTAPAPAQERAILGPAPVLTVGSAEAASTRRVDS